METCLNYCFERNRNDYIAYFSSDEQRWINRIRKLQKQHPGEITILAEPGENDGCIYCSIPQSWFKIQPPIKRELSEDELNAIKERLKNARNK